MKRLILAVFLACFMLTFVYSTNAGTKKPYCPHDVNHTRLDIPKNPSNPTRIANASWVEINRHVGDWGNSACIDPGESCVRNDNFTWWYSKKPAVNDDLIEGKDMKGLRPVRWDSKKNDYIWAN